MARDLNIATAKVFEPLLHPSRYKGAYGGRGSGKSHFFAEAAVERCLLNPGHRVLCGREVQKSLRESAKRLVEDKIAAMKAPGFRVLDDRIVTPGDGLIVFQGLAEHTADTIKSYEGFDLFWIEEAHKVRQRSLDILRPTLRKPGSELWFSWNPFRKSDPVDALLRGPNAGQLGAVVVQANWRDNPWFPAVLQAERSYDEEHSPETYQHVWEGAYASVVKGAYYAASLAAAMREGRICRVAIDPLMTVRAIWDIGGTGAKSDACSIWIAQFIGKSINVLNYYEAVGQPLAAHVNWLRESGYDKCLCILPHDGSTHDRVYDVSYESALKAAEFPTLVIPNQGTGAAMLRVEAARRRFPSIWFNEATTVAGREALGAYHEKLDDQRMIGLGPEHDWASNGADSFGLMCWAYDPPKIKRDEPERIFTVQEEDQGVAWMAS